MPTVHLESDDGVSIRLVEVDGDPIELLDAIGSLAADAPTVSVVPCGAQFGVGPVRARTDFNDDVLTAVHEVVHYVIAGTGTLSVTTADFHQSAPDVAILDAIEFTKLVVDDGTRHEFALQPDTDEFHQQGGHDQQTHGNRSRIGRIIDKILPSMDYDYVPVGRVYAKTLTGLAAPDPAAHKVRRDAHKVKSMVSVTRDDLNTRAAKLFGKGQSGDMDADLDHLFANGAVTTTVPFRQASRRKRENLYDKELVAEVLSHDRILRKVDPRAVHATQPGLSREGVRYYMSGKYENTGRPFADEFTRGNVNPVVYKTTAGQWAVLSGHHRFAAGLLQGRAIDAVVIDPDAGRPPRRVRTFRVAASHIIDDMYRDVTPTLAVDDEFAQATDAAGAVALIRSGHGAVVGNDADAVEALIELGSNRKHAEWLVVETAQDEAIAVEFTDAPKPRGYVRPPRVFGRTGQFHLQGQHDQSTHGRRGGKADGPAMDIPSIANELGAAVPLPTLDELRAYDPVPYADGNQNLLLQHLDANGQLTAERRMVHDRLVYESLTRDPEKYPDQAGELYPSQPEGQRRALLMGGGPAAGKTVTQTLGYVETPPDAAEINPDDFKIELPEATGPSSKGKQGNGLADTYPEEWASVVHDESSFVGKRAIDGATAMNMNVIIDKVQSKGYKTVAEIQKLQSMGYQVDAAFVTTDIDRAVDVAMERGDEKGRYVPGKVVRSGHEGANRAYLEVVRDTDVPAQLMTTYPKNPDGSYRDPVPTATATGKGGLRVHNRTAWDEYVARIANDPLLDDIEITFDEE